ncbi:PREDICTED: calreticulin-1-like [Camelina sativa]|uniref:Calreticulin-1-like n=1 Tax=Camelina sativa TaxID=90675 RepID=A0ABM0T0J1_CAMSA|nr:PREDICTED: calreticulin-1-like [Camelina sativa]
MAKLNPNLISLILFALVVIVSAEVIFEEKFDDGWESRWVKSDWKKDDNTAGEWKHTAGNWSGDANDKGIQTSEDYRFYAISAEFPEFSNKDKTLVFQFSVKHEQKLDCGGGYMKLLSDDVDQKKFGGDTPYSNGEWKPKKIKNPNYKGKWKAPMIDNPEFKDDPELYVFPKLKYVGVELWQVKSGSLFDNVLVSDDPEYAKKLAEETWGKHKDAEKAAFDEAEKKKEEEESKDAPAESDAEGEAEDDDNEGDDSDNESKSEETKESEETDAAHDEL